MPAEIRFRVKGRWAEEDVACRLAVLVAGPSAIVTDLATGERQVPWQKTGGYKWTLEPGNDWFMDIDPQTGEYVLAYRYGGPDFPKVLEGLKPFLEWIFN
jgi:hypothetical protein